MTTLASAVFELRRLSLGQWWIPLELIVYHWSSGKRKYNIAVAVARATQHNANQTIPVPYNRGTSLNCGV